jgi:hypothetical protein
MIPKLVKTPMEIFADPAIIAVLSASLISPFIVPHINALIEQTPLKAHKSIGAFVMGVIIFAFVAPISTNVIIKSIILGIAGGFVLTSVLPLYDQITKQEGA